MPNTITLGDGDTVVDTGQSITHRGVPYKICHTADPRADCPYVLVGSRGAAYILIRNKPKPHMLFGVAYGNMKCLAGWFDDKDGTLKSLG